MVAVVLSAGKSRGALLLLAAALVAGLLACPLSAIAAGDVEAQLRAAASGAHRSPANRERDLYRHPVETLLFFGIKPDMTVVEIYPGSGWYTEILAPFLKERGKLFAASWDRDNEPERVRQNLDRFHEKLRANPEAYSGVAVTALSRHKTEIAPRGSADMVLTFRNIHNWMKTGFDGIVFRAMYDALKPGGVLGVVEHRGNPEVWQDPQALSGYVNEEHVVQLAEAAGFRLAARSEINANAKDTKDYPEGVWTLPPTLRLKDKDRDKYMAIGESDRMTLKFVKPEK
ncbi:MAG: methyltransferase [Pseudomonadota bacterium]|nr:methyltransferase [Pseudomonadota bacterium]